MFDRSLWNALMLIGLALPIAGCNTSSGGLDSIAVTPNTDSLVVGGPTLQLTATGTFGNSKSPTTQVITTSVTWSSAIPGVATVSSAGVVTAVGPGTTTITATGQGYAGPVSGTAQVTVTGGSGVVEGITGLSIIPNTQSVALAGQTGQFIALGTTSSGLQQNLTTSVTWTSSNTSVATISATGLATAVGSGTTTITAIATNLDKTVVTATGTFTVTGVTSEPLISLAITPSTLTVATAGQTGQFIAIGTFAATSSTPGTRDLTTTVAWASSNPQVATITANGGLATATGPGTTVITAIATNPDKTVVTQTATFTVTGSGTSSTEPLASLAIVPASQASLTTGAGANVNFIAIGTTGSGATVNLTNQSATIGKVTVAAASWYSSNPAVASVNLTTGVATPITGGATAITAIATNPDGTVVTATAAYTVTVPAATEPLVSLVIVPNSQDSLSTGATANVNFVAIGTTGSGATVDMNLPYNVPGTSPQVTIPAATFGSSNPAVASFNGAEGVATPVSGGATAITAIVRNPDGTVVTASAAYTVTVAATKEPIVSLAILPASQTSLATGAVANVQFIAIGTTASGTTVNMNQPYSVPGTTPQATIPAATWSSSNPAVASFSGNPEGVATPKAGGATAITAIVTNPDGTVVTASAAYTVTVPANPEPYVSLAIVPASQTITAASQTAQFFAIGTTAAGTTVDLTSQAIWSSSSNAVAAPSAVIKGQFATPVNGPSGAVAITAEFNNSNVNGASDLTSETASAVLTVAIPATPEPLLSMAIVPGSGSVPAGQPTQFLALGTFSASAPTPGVQNMASASGYTVSWYSSNPAVATVCAAPGPCTTTQGAVTGTPVIVSGFTQGTTVITAIASGNPNGNLVTANATFTVTGPSASAITALSIVPASQSIVMPEVGQPNPTVSLVVLGTNGAGLQSSVTPQVWTSSNPAVLPSANIVSGANSTVATVVGPGTTTITASYTNVASASIPVSSVVTATATLTVTGPAQEPLLSIAINPSSPSVAFPTQTDQLTAIGTYSAAPVTQNLTSTVAWKSSNLSVATVCTAGSAAPCTSATDGLVTAVGQGTTAITATTSNPDGSLVYATVPFTVTGGSAQQMTELTIVPGALTLSATGQAGSLIALGTSGSSGLQEDVTASPQVVWTSSNPTIATVSSLPGAGAGQTQTCALNNATPPVTVCTPDPPGLVKGVSAGSTTITAEFFDQAATTTTPAVVVTATANVTVTTTPAAEPLLSITILPSSISTGNLYGNGQFLAYGAFSTDPTEMDITNGFFHAGFPGTGYPSSSCTTALAAADAATAAADAAARLPVNNLPNPQCGFVPVTWISDAPFIFPIDSSGAAGATGGLVTAEGNGTDIIYAQATNPDGTIVYSTTPATFNCPYKAPTYATTTTYVNGLPVVSYTSQVIDPGSCNDLTIAPELVSTVTVYGVGLNIGSQPPANWLVTAPSATGTPNVIHCGGTAEQATAQGSVCTAAYPNGTLLTLTAPHVDGVNFGGWSDNCAPVGAVTAAGPNSCTITVGSDATSNVSVVAIFN